MEKSLSPSTFLFQYFHLWIFENDDIVVKFRIRALQPTGLANLMKLQNIYKKRFYNVWKACNFL